MSDFHLVISFSGHLIIFSLCLSLSLSGVQSKGLSKQSGFTLIELMVVMAIIAILATAGLSAYTGYIKKARDATRIADLAAINTIILANMATGGLPPANAETLSELIKASNNGQRIVDPLTTGTDIKKLCETYIANDINLPLSKYVYYCAYYYVRCDGGTGYFIGALFESPSNMSLYMENNFGAMPDRMMDPYPMVFTYYDMGSCTEGIAGEYMYALDNYL